MIKILSLELAMKIKSLKESEKDHLLAVLNQTHWDLVKTSRLLKISLDLLKAKIRAFGLDQQEKKNR